MTTMRRRLLIRPSPGSPWTSLVTFYVSDSDSGHVLRFKGGVGLPGRREMALGAFPAMACRPSTAGLFSPLGVAIDSLGNLYIADTRTFGFAWFRMQLSALWRAAATRWRQRTSRRAWLDYPAGVAVDSSGVSTSWTQTIIGLRKVSNGVIATLAGTGLPGCAGDNGLATGARLGRSPQFAPSEIPQGLIGDPLGNSMSFRLDLRSASGGLGWRHDHRSG